MLLFATTWMDLEGIMLIEISYIMLIEISHKKEKCCMFTQSKKKKKKTVDYNKRETESPAQRMN